MNESLLRIPYTLQKSKNPYRREKYLQSGNIEMYLHPRVNRCSSARSKAELYRSRSVGCRGTVGDLFCSATAFTFFCIRMFTCSHMSSPVCHYLPQRCWLFRSLRRI